MSIDIIFQQKINQTNINMTRSHGVLTEIVIRNWAYLQVCWDDRNAAEIEQAVSNNNSKNTAEIQHGLLS